MRVRMPSTTRNRVLLGVSIAVPLYVTLATIYGSDWHPFTNDFEENAASIWNGITDWVKGVFLWSLEDNDALNPATILVGFLAWLLVSFTARRINRQWKLTKRTATALKSKRSKTVGAQTGIILGGLVVLCGIVIGGAYGGTALGDNLRPQIVSATDTSTRWVGDRYDELMGNNEPAAAPAPALPSGNTQNEGGTDNEPAAPADTEPVVPTDDRRDNSTGDNRTETPADTRTDVATNDKPVTDALSGVLTDADRIFTDPVKFAEDNVVRAIFWGLSILLALALVVIIWRRRVVKARELASLKATVNSLASTTRRLDGYATDDNTAIEALKADVAELKAGGKRVAGGPTT